MFVGDGVKNEGARRGALPHLTLSCFHARYLFFRRCTPALCLRRGKGAQTSVCVVLYSLLHRSLSYVHVFPYRTLALCLCRGQG